MKITQKFIIDPSQIVNSQIKIQGQDARHILKVLRLNKGDTLSLTDGNGQDYEGTIVETSSSSLHVEPGLPVPSSTESPLWITLCSGMLKYKKMDWIIENLVPIGISEWVPFFCQRSVPRPDAKAVAKKFDRWQTIVKESLKQCRRSNLVKVHSPMNFPSVMELSQDFDTKIAFWEEENTANKPDWKSLAPAKRVIILIGPEGGFPREEISLAQSKGFVSCSLGPRILRGEIAALCAANLVQHEFGDM